MSTTLCLDFGNTRKKVAVFQQAELKKVLVIDNDAVTTIQSLIDIYQPGKSILSSVIDHNAAFEELLAKSTKFHKLSHLTKLEFTTPVGKPQTIGADRLALVAAAVHLYPQKNNLVIGMGSCITYNFINKYHEFIGGAISPGMEMRLRAMNQFTAKLPLVKADSNVPLIGYDTTTNLLTGAVLGTAKEIDGFIDSYKEKFGNFNVLLTGGDLVHLASHLKNKIFADPDLIFKGLYAISELNNPKKINVLGVFRFLFCFILIAFFLPAFSQDNSPYTRYGLGDLVPSTNMNTRAMGGISAGYTDFLSINFNNPASYSSFQALKEPKAKKILYGRAILDLGVNLENHTLIEPGKTGKFTSSNALFSHVQVGIPLRANWGLSFGLRPITRISYQVDQRERLHDPNTGLPIDSALTTNQGDGGTYLASVGTGFRIGKLSLGINGGYLFGKKDYSARRSFINDTVSYNSGNFETKATYGNLYFNAGLQYLVKLDSNTFMTLGAYGNLKQKLNASQDIIRETFFYDPNAGNVRIDSAYEKTGIKGKVEYPSSFTVGFIIQRIPENKKGGWLVGVDFSQTSWKNYTFYGQTDSLRNNWELRVGGELRPSLGSARKSYFGNVAYRAGFFFGPDYIQIKQKLPVFGATFGLGLPIRNYNRLSPGQATLINLALEYVKRGNNENVLKENMFRVSVGFALSDFWFAKKKYE